MGLISGLPDDLARECLIRIPYTSLRSVLSVCKAWNSEIQSQDFNRLRRLSGYTHPVFILSQCCMNLARNTATFTYLISVFDPKFGSFTKLPSGPESHVAEPASCRIIGVASMVVVFIFGDFDHGLPNNTEVHVFDFSTGKWRKGATMPKPDGVLYELACDSGTMKPTLLHTVRSSATEESKQKFLLYDVRTDTWKTTTNTKNERIRREVMFHTTDKSPDPDSWWWGPEDDFAYTCENASQLIMENGEGELYRYYIGRKGTSVEIRRGDKWRKVLDLSRTMRRLDIVSASTWRDKMMLVEFSEDVSCCGHVLDLKTLRWTQVGFPEDFKVIMSCPVYSCGMDL